jgi:hypothetical protein
MKDLFNKIFERLVGTENEIFISNHPENLSDYSYKYKVARTGTDWKNLWILFWWSERNDFSVGIEVVRSEERPSFDSYEKITEPISALTFYVLKEEGSVLLNFDPQPFHQGDFFSVYWRIRMLSIYMQLSSQINLSDL